MDTTTKPVHKNCCQQVLLSFSSELELSEDELMKLGAPFGGGMGDLSGTCGALIGAQMVLGLKKYQDKPIGRDAAALVSAFRDKCGDTICRNLKGIDTKKVLCACDDCIKNAIASLKELT